MAGVQDRAAIQPLEAWRGQYAKAQGTLTPSGCVAGFSRSDKNCCEESQKWLLPRLSQTALLRHLSRGSLLLSWAAAFKLRLLPPTWVTLQPCLGPAPYPIDAEPNPHIGHSSLTLDLLHHHGLASWLDSWGNVTATTRAALLPLLEEGGTGPGCWGTGLHLLCYCAQLPLGSIQPSLCPGTLTLMLPLSRAVNSLPHSKYMFIWSQITPFCQLC